MLLLGLTGSIATGKSSVSNILRAPPYNLPIIDADILARQVVEPGTAGYRKVVEYFSSSTPDLLVSPAECGGHENGADGKGRPLNRPALGRRVFGDEPDKKRDRAELGKIIHPAVRWEMYKAMFYYYLTGHWAVVLDIPLLFESGWEKICGTVLVVAVTEPETQMKRLRERDQHLTAEDAKNRVGSQMDIRDKADKALRRGPGAGVVVWNDGDKQDLKKELDRVMIEVRRSSPTWWAWLLLLCPPVMTTTALYSFLRSTWIQRQLANEKQQEKAKL